MEMHLFFLVNLDRSRLKSLFLEKKWLRDQEPRKYLLVGFLHQLLKVVENYSRKLCIFVFHVFPDLLSSLFVFADLTCLLQQISFKNIFLGLVKFLNVK